MRRLCLLFLFLTYSVFIFSQEFDSITDVRDGQVYKIVKIDQDWWMAENLNTGTRLDGGQSATDNGVIEKYCYNDEDSLCDTYGGLYTWDELLDYYTSSVLNRGICPYGWHVPNHDAWQAGGCRWCVERYRDG